MIFYVHTAWPKKEVNSICERSGSYSGYKNSDFMEMSPGGGLRSMSAF